MVPHLHLPDLSPEREPGLPPVSRRVLLRRSLLGITTLGMASLLAACGGDDDDQEGAAGDEPPPAPELDPDAPTIAPDDQDAGEDEAPGD